jgi:hypothetical protein
MTGRAHNVDVKWRAPTSVVKKARAENLILLVCQRMEDCPEFGAIVLAKILYYIDHAHYLKYGKKLTGFSYVRQRLGPTPKPSEFLPIKEQLIASGRMEEKQVEYFGRLQKRARAVAKPDVTVFSPEQVELIDSIINSFIGVNGKLASDLTHEEISWKIAGPMEELPDYAYLLTEADLDESDLAWAKKAIHAYSGAKICNASGRFPHHGNAP